MPYSLTPHWKEADIDFLTNLAADTGESTEDILAEVTRYACGDVEAFLNIQSHIYTCMSLIVNNFMDAVVDRVDVGWGELPEPNISLNYLCSVYDSVYNDYDLTDLEGEVDRFIKEQLNE